MPQQIDAVLWVWVCRRMQHAIIVSQGARFVICPSCGSMGETVEVRVRAGT